MLLQRIAREPAHQHPLPIAIVRNYMWHAAANTARQKNHHRSLARVRGHRLEEIFSTFGVDLNHRRRIPRAKLGEAKNSARAIGGDAIADPFGCVLPPSGALPIFMSG